MKVKFTLSAKDAEEVVGDYHYELERVTIQGESKHRWYNRQLVVFKEANLDVDPLQDLYGFYYLEPSTEIQEGQDRFESDPVECFLVKKEEVTKIIYSID